MYCMHIRTTDNDQTKLCPCDQNNIFCLIQTSCLFWKICSTPVPIKQYSSCFQIMGDNSTNNYKYDMHLGQCTLLIYISVNRWYHVPRGSQSMFQRFYVPKVLCSEGSIFRRFYVPKVLYSEGSIFRRFYLPKVLCSECPLPLALRSIAPDELIIIIICRKTSVEIFFV